ncbi:M1 family peptidase [Altericroceibacterium spongiae]|uniref:M1 family peptidase n=2 Tax=Altericroceibacterium spongiae TaxID=2320269 RepID=A0A420EEF9_9SPHN|nr:M1 family peptidase [Altericroceibacterium spongiae]
MGGLIWSLGLSPSAMADETGQSPLAKHTEESGASLDTTQQAMALPYLALSLSVDPKSKSIAGIARYTIRSDRQLTHVEFDLDPRFEVSAIELNDIALAPDLWGNDNGLLTIKLPHVLDAGDTAKVSIAYSGKPRIAPKAPWDGGFVWSETQDGSPWIATAVQTNGCDLFWPCIDHPTKRVEWLDFAVSVPAPLVVAANGTLQQVTEKDGWNTYRWQAHWPQSYGVSLQIGPYKLAEKTYRSRFGNSFPIKFWYLPGHKKGAEKLLGQMHDFLDFFEKTVGPYPFSDEKAGLAETPHLGMEHQTINAYGNGFRLAPEGYDWLMHHEFSHEWFANQLTDRTVADMWLHEGYGTYMQPLYLRWSKGETAYRAALWDSRKKIISRVPLAPKSAISSAYYNDEEAGWGGDIYYKGAWILHSLREYIGDEAFFAGTTKLVYGTSDPKPGQFRWQLADTEDFQHVMEEVTGLDLSWFVDAYFRHAALPELISEQDGQILRLRWKSGAKQPFILPVEVQIGNRIEQVTMTGGKGRIDLGSPDAHYIIDPNTKILRFDPDIAAWQKQEGAERARTGPESD